MRIYDLNPVVNEDNEMSDVITARGLVNRALDNPAARQEYFDYMTHLRNKHGKEYSTRIHQQATALAKSVDETIKKVGSQYELVSKSGKNLGKYPTRAGAEKREQQVNYFKHVKEDAWTGENPAWHNGNDQWNDGTDQWHSADDGAGSSGGAGGGGSLKGATPVEKSLVEPIVTEPDAKELATTEPDAKELATTKLDAKELDTEELDESFNPEDIININVPLLLRLFEYARNDAKTDMDLHTIAERLIAPNQEGRTLTMQDYNTICNTKETD